MGAGRGGDLPWAEGGREWVDGLGIVVGGAAWGMGAGLGGLEGVGIGAGG